MLASENGMSEPVRDVILPAIMSNCHFRLKDTLQIFLTFEEDMHVPAMLYFFLALDQDQRGTQTLTTILYFVVPQQITLEILHRVRCRVTVSSHFGFEL